MSQMPFCYPYIYLIDSLAGYKLLQKVKKNFLITFLYFYQMC